MTVLVMCLLPIVKVSSALSAMITGMVMTPELCAGQASASVLVIALDLPFIDNLASPPEQPQQGHVTELFPQLSPWMKLAVPPVIITSWIAPTILMITVAPLKELELSAFKSLKQYKENC